MKTYNRYMAAFAAVAMAFASCSEDEAFAPNASDMVQIASAQIAVETTTRVNSLGAGDVFENGDNILLVNHSRGVHNKGTYTATISGSTAQWNLTDGAVLWAPGSGENQLTAYHPATDQFVLPADQSTEEKLIAADHMTATAVASRGDVVDLTFSRHMAKVTFVPRLVEGLTTVNSFTIATTDAATPSVTPFTTSSGYFTAILTPGTYAAGETVVTMTASNSTQQFSFVAKTKNALTLEAGKAYTLDIQVGKDIVAFNNIRVQSWTDYALGSEDAEEFSYSYDAATKTLTVLHADMDNDYQLSTVLQEYLALGAVNFVLGGCPTPNNYYKINNGESNVSLTLPDVVSMEYADCWVYGEKITELNLPQVRKLGEGAIYNTGLTEFKIPATVTEIYGNPFVLLMPGMGVNSDHRYADNPDLATITVASDNKNFSIDNNKCLYNVSDANNKVLVTDLDAYKGSSVSVPLYTTAIGAYAFKDHYMLTSATIANTIENTVTSIGDYAFYNCKKLASIEIPSSVTHIGEKAFYNNGVNLTITYDGTMAQAKVLFAKSGIKTGDVIICSDGTYTHE